MVISNLNSGQTAIQKTRNGRFESTTANPLCTHAAVVAHGRRTKIMGATDKEPRTPPLAFLRPNEHGPATERPDHGGGGKAGPQDCQDLSVLVFWCSRSALWGPEGTK